MYFLYNFLTILSWQLLKLSAFFKPKMKLFVKGRRGVFEHLEEQLKNEDKVIWIHTASLGEFEQGLPVIKALKSSYPGFKILVTFFSPSGYEVKKKSGEADLITYLPIDTSQNVDRFLKVVRPALAIFVKYEIWPNYLRGLSKRQIPTIMISGRFGKDQVFFKWYGSFMRKALMRFSHFFVQDKGSKELLQGLGLTNITLSGDTRFDRVYEILQRDNSLNFMGNFKGDGLCFVLGSTWPEDEALLIPYLQEAPEDLKFVIAPHNIKDDHLNALKNAIKGDTILYSETEKRDPSMFRILILDTIGLLTKVYSYADIAYVGGGFATGLHNTLEPAVFGIPVLTGPQFHGFKEAEDLVELGGIRVITNKESFSETVSELIRDSQSRERKGKINLNYVTSRTGATKKIMDYINARVKD